MDNFILILQKIKNPYYNYFLILPDEIQEIIYNIIKNDLLKENLKIQKYRINKQIKLYTKPLVRKYYDGFLDSSYIGGAWETLYLNRNKWINIYENLYKSYNNKFSYSALRYCRHQFIINPP